MKSEQYCAKLPLLTQICRLGLAAIVATSVICIWELPTADARLLEASKGVELHASFRRVKEGKCDAKDSASTSQQKLHGRTIYMYELTVRVTNGSGRHVDFVQHPPGKADLVGVDAEYVRCSTHSTHGALGTTVQGDKMAPGDSWSNSETYWFFEEPRIHAWRLGHFWFYDPDGADRDQATCGSGTKKCGNRCIPANTSCCSGRPGYKRCGSTCVRQGTSCNQGERSESQKTSGWGDWARPSDDFPKLAVRVRCRPGGPGIEYQPEFANLSDDTVRFSWRIYGKSGGPPGKDWYKDASIGAGDRLRGDFQEVIPHDKCFEESVRIDIEPMESQKDEKLTSERTQPGAAGHDRRNQQRFSRWSSWWAPVADQPFVEARARCRQTPSGVLYYQLQFRNTSSDDLAFKWGIYTRHRPNKLTDSINLSAGQTHQTKYKPVSATGKCFERELYVELRGTAPPASDSGEQVAESSQDRSETRREETATREEQTPRRREREAALRRKQERERQRRREERRRKKQAWEERRDERRETQDDYEEAMGEYANTVASMESTESQFASGSVFHTHLGLGGGFGLAPLYENVVESGDYAADPKTRKSSALGLTFDLRFQMWPVRGRNGEIALFSGAKVGGVAGDVGATYLLEVLGGMRLSLGFRSAKLLIEGGFGHRAGAMSTDMYSSITGTQTSGLGTLSTGFGRLGGGLRFSGGKDGGLWTLDFVLLNDILPVLVDDDNSVERGPSQPILYGLRFWSNDSAFVSAVFSHDYRRAGDVDHPTESEGSGPYVRLTVGRSFDWTSAYGQ